MARVPRRYGSTFNSFDQLVNASACAQKMSKVDIDCRFRHSQTKWGVLGRTQNQAGILYMDITFAQSKDCRLSSATVWMSLEDPEHIRQATRSGTPPAQPASRENRIVPRDHLMPGLSAARDKKKVFDGMRRKVEEDGFVYINCFPQFTHDFGPRQLMGRPTPVTTKKTRHLTPQVNVLGNGGGGLGWEIEQSIEHSSRWSFTGNLIPGSRLEENTLDRAYRTLKWELSEDEFQPLTTHNNTFHTAFTLEHANQEFFLRIEIQGKLEKKQDRMKNNVKHLFKFPRGPSGSPGVSLTRFPPQEVESITRLDNIAQGLSYDMECLNLQAIPPEIPPALPVSFQEIAPLSQDDGSTTTTTAVEENITNHSIAERKANTKLPDLQVPARISSFPEAEDNIAGRALKNDILVKTQCLITEPPARNHREQATFKVEDERDKDMSPNVHAKEVRTPQAAAESVRISPRLEPFEEKPSDDDLKERALQLAAQFPFLFRILWWIFTMMNFTPNEAPRRTLESSKSIPSEQDDHDKEERLNHRTGQMKDNPTCFQDH